MSPARRPASSTPIAFLAPLVGAALLMLVACGGGGSSVSAPSPSSPTPIGDAPTATPTGSGTPISSPTPATGAGAVIVSPNALSFFAAGPGVPTQAVTAAQSSNSGGFALSSSNCAGIASVSPTSGAGPFNVAPIAAGTCTYVVTGTGAKTATVSITVTTTTLPQN